MSIINEILESDAHPQSLSPLFTRLSLELRLMIYKFVFMGCQVSFSLKEIDWFGQLWDGAPEEPDDWHVCHYNHIGGGFGLLRTCRMTYIEAFDTYWSEAVFRLDHVGAFFCEFGVYCDYLPAAIKANVRHIRCAFVPILVRVEDLHRVPAQLAELPKLISFAFFTRDIWLCELLTESYPPIDKFTVLKVPDTETRAQGYEGVGPFHLESGENPVTFIERTIGFRLSDGVTILSYGFDEDFPRDPDYKRRTQIFNWGTGMVYQTTSDLGPLGLIAEEDAYQQALRARPGDEWSRSYDVLD